MLHSRIVSLKLKSPVKFVYQKINIHFILGGKSCPTIFSPAMLIHNDINIPITKIFDFTDI